ncbi:hypothetical protein QJS10_CPA09g00222 [Acorus calamus]|uniref:Uncharacterized protein n=1 Tax=Acorus calamus TaxID=4465 RepID=A0AAV9E5K3_ACOCL|nr:hypothetical protein QJS10_CPA09g00222 [Acorus calamus]
MGTLYQKGPLKAFRAWVFYNKHTLVDARNGKELSGGIKMIEKGGPLIGSIDRNRDKLRLRENNSLTKPPNHARNERRIIRKRICRRWSVHKGQKVMDLLHNHISWENVTSLGVGLRDIDKMKWRTDHEMTMDQRECQVNR